MNSTSTDTLAMVVKSLTRDYGLSTPLLLVNEQCIEDALGLFNRYLPEVSLFYAVKANSARSIISFLGKRGLSFDVASAGEVELVSGLGIPGSKMLLSAPVKTAASLEALFTHNIRFCAVDSIAEVERILDHRNSRDHQHLPRIFIRLRVESKNVEVDLNTKFGCTIAEALSITEYCVDHNCIVEGICFHVGTQSTNADNYHLGLESAMVVAKEVFRRLGVKISIINIGGGFCDSEAAERSGVSLAELYASIGEASRNAMAHGYRVIAEPGRCLVSAAGVLLTSVIGTNIRNNQRWAFLDDGIYGCYSNKLYENPRYEFHRVSTARRMFVGVNQNTDWTVAGPTCDSLDVIATDVKLPYSLQTGDVLATPNIGAYSLASATTFNGFAPPQCVLYRTVSTPLGTQEVLLVEGDGKRLRSLAAA